MLLLEPPYAKRLMLDERKGAGSSSPPARFFGVLLRDLGPCLRRLRPCPQRMTLAAKYTTMAAFAEELEIFRRIPGMSQSEAWVINAGR
jgi:hypothetical protein